MFLDLLNCYQNGMMSSHCSGYGANSSGSSSSSGKTGSDIGANNNYRGFRATESSNGGLIIGAGLSKTGISFIKTALLHHILVVFGDPNYITILHNYFISAQP